MRKHREFFIAKAGFHPLKLGIVASHTMDYLAAALPGTGFAIALWLMLFSPAMVRPRRSFSIQGPNFATSASGLRVVAFDFRALGFRSVFLKKEEADEAVSAAINHVSSMAAGVRDIVRATCILQTLVPPSDPVFGGLDARIQGSPRAMIERFNVRLLQEVAKEKISSSMPHSSPAK